MARRYREIAVLHVWFQRRQEDPSSGWREEKACSDGCAKSRRNQSSNSRRDPEPVPAPAPVTEDEPSARPSADRRASVNRRAEPQPAPQIVAELPLTPVAEPWLTCQWPKSRWRWWRKPHVHVTPPHSSVEPRSLPSWLQRPLVEPVIETCAELFLSLSRPWLLSRCSSRPATSPYADAAVDDAPVVPAHLPCPSRTSVPPVPSKDPPNPSSRFLRPSASRACRRPAPASAKGMASLFLGKKAIDDDMLDELETRLLTADVGVEATTAIMQQPDPEGGAQAAHRQPTRCTSHCRTN